MTEYLEDLGVEPSYTPTDRLPSGAAHELGWALLAESDPSILED